MAQTLLQMMTLALSQSGLDSSFLADARQWYNTIVNKKTDDFNYPFYRTSVTQLFTPGVKNYALPADYKHADTLYVIDANGNTGQQVPLVESYLFDQYNRGNSSGLMSLAYVDLEAGELIVNATPSTVNGQQGYRLNYFRNPENVDLAGADDGTVPDFKDQNTIIEELKAMALEFRDDARYQAKKAEAKASDVGFQRNMQQNDALSQSPLNAVYFRGTNRRTRGLGWGNSG